MKKLFLFLILSFLLGGCLPKEIIDDVNLVFAVGYDFVDDEKIKTTFAIPVFQKDAPTIDQHIIETGITTRENLGKMQKKSQDPLATGKLQIAVFGEEVGEKGIFELIDSMHRDPSVGSRVYLAIARGTAKEMLFSQVEGKKEVAGVMSTLIEHNTELRDLPETNMHTFLFNYYSKTRDPFLPILKKEEKRITIDGIALMKDDKVVDYLSNDQLFFFKLLTDRYTDGSFPLKGKIAKAQVESISSNMKMKLKNNEGSEIDMNLDIKGIVNEFTGPKLTPKIINKIQKNFEEKVTSECDAQIQKFKELGIDPVGIGAFVKTHSREFDPEKWDEQYKNVKVNIHTNVEIIESGVIE